MKAPRTSPRRRLVIPSIRRVTNRVLLSCLVGLVVVLPARAQQPTAIPAQQPEPPPAGGTFEEEVTILAGTTEFREGHTISCGNAEWELRGGVKFFADCVDYSSTDRRLVARGNVVFTNPEGRIAAEVVEFDLGSGLGTFYGASGLMSLGPEADRRQFGNQDPDVYFWGERIEKLGPRKYHIVDGGFTTCVQPTARWELRTGTVTLNLDDYAFARNTVLRVKGVPLLYLPFIYYPLQQDDRATGFLLPTYGTSTLRGQAISNAFFWAINRSQDATFFHDWFTRTGQGAGVEYRYVASAQSSGSVRYYLLDQKHTEFTVNNQLTTLAQTRSFELTGNATHQITPRLRARARVDYVSDLLTQQLYNQNVARASNPIRTVDGNLTGTFGPVSTSASFQRTETFSSQTQSHVYGGTPRITANVAPRQIFGTPIYAGLTSEYAYLPYRTISDGAVTLDRSLTRIDLSPTARIPLSTLPFLTVNSSATFRSTYYSRSVDAAGVTIDEPLRRQYLTLRTNVIGPVLTRIWDTPSSARSQRMKHVIEPTFTVDYFTPIANYTSTPVLSDVTELVVGGMAQFTYGVNNRLFYRSRAGEGSRSTTREFVTIGLQQTYYTKPEASRNDPQYSSIRVREVQLSPVALTARFSPSPLVDANSRVEYDVSGQGLQLLSVGSSVTGGNSTSNVTFSRTRAQSSSSSYLSGSTSLAFRQNRLRTQYALSWNIASGYIVSQRVAATYLAQCCGFELEFQNFNFPPSSGYPIPADRRVNVSFILAGLGTFSNFFGAFGGQR